MIRWKILRINEVVVMLFEDKYGKVLISDEVNDLSPWEIEDRGIHVYGDKSGL